MVMRGSCASFASLCFASLHSSRSINAACGSQLPLILAEKECLLLVWLLRFFSSRVEVHRNSLK